LADVGASGPSASPTLWRAKREFLSTQEEFIAFLRGFDVPPAVLIPHDLNEQRISEAARNAGALDIHIVAPSSSETVARLALLKLAAGETITVDQLDANYLRRDQALYK
jgi:hypothetical protein